MATLQQMQQASANLKAARELDKTHGLYVNTIRFNGEMGIINSFGVVMVAQHPILREEMERQQAHWAAQYPNATVATEHMAEADVIAHFQATGRNFCNELARRSEGK